MIKKVFRQIFSKELPTWFRVLNFSILLPILLCPLVFFGTIFFFDNPKNLGLTYLVFFLVNAYPVYLIVIAYFNSLLFKKSKTLGSLLPLTILATIIYGLIYFIIETKQNLTESKSRQEERDKKGYIGANDDFKIINDKVYRYDTLINEADAKTFEIISWDWERDKNFYYRFGKKVSIIDRQSFQLLDYHYAKDKNYVYYDENVIEGADTKTFHHIEGTQDGKDTNSCYRWGKKVECKVLLTEE